jgi:hypothetical protein
MRIFDKLLHIPKIALPGKLILTIPNELSQLKPIHILGVLLHNSIPILQTLT